MTIHRSLLAAVALATGLATTARAAVETHTIDPVHSTVSFSLRHLVSKFTGGFTKVTGAIQVDRENLEKSSVQATIEVGSINTADEKRNGHLLAPDFFDAAKFPTITFKSASWKKTGGDTFDVTGDLTMRGVTKSVVLKVTSLGFGPGMKPGSTVSGWEIATTLKKSEFGLGGPAMLGKVLGDDVTVSIGIEAGK
jgi:polyisoprenoid-binding protein YceI